MNVKQIKTRDKWLEKARTLSEALPYMRRYTGATFVIKYGGHAMGDADLAKLFARDIVLLRQVGINPVVVHGGGPQIGQMLERLKIKSAFIDGLRVTDKDTVDVVEMVLAGSINKSIVSAINEAGGFAVGLSGKDGNLIRAQRLRRTKRDPGSNIERILDLGLVGEPTEINPHVLDFYERSDITPVIAPIGSGAQGETLNVNADTAAGAVAGAMKAEKLVVVSDTHGIRADVNDPESRISHLTVQQIDEMVKSGAIGTGMLPKVEACITALRGGVQKAHIINGRIPHALMLEIYTESGIGTEIVL